MKKITLLFTFLLLSVAFTNAQTVDINFNATNFDTSGIGFLNVFDNPKDGNVGAFQFASGWGVADLIALNDTGANTLTLLPNRIGDPDPYWQSAGILEGNKLMEANHYIQDDALIGSTVNFYGNVQSNNLDNGVTLSFEFTHVAFIKVFNDDYSSVVASDFHDLGTTGDFSLSLDASSYPATHHVQYGFTVFGPNINSDSSFDGAYGALGSIVIIPNTTLGVSKNTISNYNVSPNPSNNVWNIKGEQTIETIQVFDVLGKQVMNVKPNNTDVELNANTLPKGLYFAKMTTEFGSNTIKLIKN